jgi:hypothetical protein
MYIYIYIYMLKKTAASFYLATVELIGGVPNDAAKATTTTTTQLVVC